MARESLAMLLILATAACAPYQFGVRSMYPTDVRTVHVPLFTSDGFRRNMAERLTEAVVKRIEDTTPYKVVGPATADSVLIGRLGPDSKRVLVENATDEPRDVQLNLVVYVDWKTRNEQLLLTRQVDVPSSTVEVAQATSVVPEVGQSVATSHQQAIEKLAAQIVAMMEAPW